MKIGINTMLWKNCFTSGDSFLLERAAKIGYSLVELSISADSLPEEQEVCCALKRNELKASVCCLISPQQTLVSPLKDVRKKAIEKACRVVTFANAIGAESVAGPLFTNGRPPLPRTTRERNDEWMRACESLEILSEFADTAGITICIEPVNRYKSDLVNTAGQAVEMIRQIGTRNSKVLFDTYHANIEETDITGALRSFGSYLGEVHFCDNQKGAPGSGHIDFLSIAAALRNMDYKGPVVFESFVPYDKDNIWTPLAATQDELAEAAFHSMNRLLQRAHNDQKK